MSDLIQLQSDLEATEALWKNAQEERDTAWKLVSQYKEANAANLQEVMRLRAALKNTYEALKDPAFVRCSRCGWQEPTSDLDVMSLYIEPALGIEE